MPHRQITILGMSQRNFTLITIFTKECQNYFPSYHTVLVYHLIVCHGRGFPEPTAEKKEADEEEEEKRRQSLPNIFLEIKMHFLTHYVKGK